MKLLLSFAAFLLCALSVAFGDEMSASQFQARVRTSFFTFHLNEGRRILTFLLESPLANVQGAITESLLSLRQQGFSVQGETVSPEVFRVRMRTHGEAPGTYVVHGEQLYSCSRRGFLHLAAEKLRELSRPALFFGVPNGYDRPQNFRAYPKIQHVRLMLLTEVLQNGCLAGTLKFKFGQNFSGFPNLVLSTYLYFYLSNLDEILKLKNQGGSLREVTQLGRNVIKTEPSVNLILFQNTLEEMLSTFLVQSSFLSKKVMIDNLPNTIIDAGLLAFAKGVTEKCIGKLLEEQTRLKNLGEFARAQACTYKIEGLQHAYYNLLFPILKALQLPSNQATSRYVSNAIQFLMGLTGLFHVRPPKNKEAQQKPKMAAPPCRMLLHFLGPREHHS